MITIAQVVAARPNFVKMAPVISAIGRRGVFRQLVVHTGQHYDRALSDDILADLQLPEPDLHLGIGSGSHGEQTGRTLIEFERVLGSERPGLVVVAGDVNATLACALAASKLGIPIAHVESGLRCGDWEMPEEQNRVLTDRLSSLLFTHSPETRTNLQREGIEPSRIHYVGNTMIDSLRRYETRARTRAAWRHFHVREHEYVLVTLHRPSNVDDPAKLSRVVDALVELASRAPVIFPFHPRTRARLDELGGLERLARAGVRCAPALRYLEFLSLEAGAGAIVTDSGGVQEEAAALGVTCYTLRSSTERPVTITYGTNTLLGDDPAALAGVTPSGHPPTPCAIPLWDGHAGERVASLITKALLSRSGLLSAALGERAVSA